MAEQITEAAKHRAIELANAVDDSKWTYTNLTASPALDALATYVQHVSDAAKATCEWFELPALNQRLAPFILPEPVDPLVEALRDNFCLVDATAFAEKLKRALDQRGLKIVPSNG